MDIGVFCTTQLIYFIINKISSLYSFNRLAEKQLTSLFFFREGITNYSNEVYNEHTNIRQHNKYK